MSVLLSMWSYIYTLCLVYMNIDIYLHNNIWRYWVAGSFLYAITCYYMQYNYNTEKVKVSCLSIYNILLSKYTSEHQNRIWSKSQSIYKIIQFWQNIRKKNQIIRIFSLCWIVLKMLNHMSPIRFINPKAFPVFHSLLLN